ncbi:UNVERIFIED_CONTAM: hypothetical protein HDU68_000271 [Siphonaria sp. JEL0065]|nr:hypothetical protein HDU68_000271 [Siphonaria sp. JEL0065]
MNLNETNGPFYTALFLTLFTGPLIGAIPLCCSDPQNLKYRGWYLRGMAFAIATGAALLGFLTVIVLQVCYNRSKSGFDYPSYLQDDQKRRSDYPYQTQQKPDCSAVSNTLVPFIVFWAVIALVLFRRSKELIESATMTGGGPVLVQVITTGGGSGSIGGQRPLVSQYYRIADDMEIHSHPELLLMAHARARAQAEAEKDAALPAYTPMEESGRQFDSAPATSSAAAGTSSGTQNQQPPAPLQPTMSLESLALYLEIPKLLTVTEGVAGIMEMECKELSEKYGVTPAEFLKIKAYRKNGFVSEVK